MFLPVHRQVNRVSLTSARRDRRETYRSHYRRPSAQNVPLPTNRSEQLPLTPYLPVRAPIYRSRDADLKSGEARRKS